MVIWTTLFIQFWKRRQTALAQQWGVLDYEAKDIANGDRNRLSYKGRGEIDGDRIIDRVTMEHVLRQRLRKVAATTPIICLLVSSCVVFMFWFLSMRASIKERTGSGVLSYALHTLLWGLIVPLLSGLHIKICHYLNEWENWRTESDQYRSYTAKVCSLLLINTFVAMYYLCCFERSLPSVAFQVASFMVARLFLDIVCSIVVLPYLRRWKMKRVIARNKKSEYDPSSIHNPNDVPSATAQKMQHQQLSNGHKAECSRKGADKHCDEKLAAKAGGGGDPKSDTVIDMTGDWARIKNSAAWHQALSPRYDSFKNYCFLILFFGYVSNFSIAFCCAPLVALIGMLFKLRSDRFHLCCNTQRPLPRRVSGIGIWLTVLEAMCTFAIITNVLILYFTTDHVFAFLAPGRDSETLTIIVFEHLLLAFRFGLGLIIPEMPLTVKAEIRIHQLTRLVRRKKLWENAQSRFRTKKRKKSGRCHRKPREDRHKHCSRLLRRDDGDCANHKLDAADSEDRHLQRLSSAKRYCGNPRAPAASIRIDDVMHAMF